MHKYQPRVHIVRKRDQTASVIDLNSKEVKTFEFRETSFIAVTAYQNQLVSKQYKLTLQNHFHGDKLEIRRLHHALMRNEICSIFLSTGDDGFQYLSDF